MAVEAFTGDVDQMSTEERRETIFILRDKVVELEERQKPDVFTFAMGAILGGIMVCVMGAALAGGSRRNPPALRTGQRFPVLIIEKGPPRDMAALPVGPPVSV